jgi:ribonuclease P/MRP protein subunit RPP40
LLSCYQHGFRAARSCQTALISLTNRLFMARGNKSFSAIATLDFSKAFDCLDHHVLLSKLSSKGLSATCMEWFGSYLLRRTQCVRYNNTLSDPLPLTTGVPQGSVFGPLLFNIYIDDLLHSLPDGSCLAYADDVTLITSGKSLDDVTHQLQALLNTTANWAISNRLSFSHSKCNVMVVPVSPRKAPSTSPCLTLDGKKLEVVEHVTILGVDICSDLTWTRQVQKTCGKISGRLAVLRRLGNSMNTNTRQQVFSGFVKSRLNYCLPVWGNTSTACQNQINGLLKRSARFILNKHDACLDVSVFDTTGLCNFRLHVLQANSSAIFNIIKAAPDRFCACKLLAMSQERCSRATLSNKLEHNVMKRKCDNSCFLSAAVTDWNSLPNDVTACSSFRSFNRGLKQYVKNSI